MAVNTYIDPIIEQLQADGRPITRENYIRRNWPELPNPWLPDHEAQLPPDLQDWAVFNAQPAPAPAVQSSSVSNRT